MPASGFPTTNAVRPGNDSPIAGPTTFVGSLLSHRAASVCIEAGRVGDPVLGEGLADGPALVLACADGSTYFVTVRLGFDEPEHAVMTTAQLSVAAMETARRNGMIRP